MEQPVLNELLSLAVENNASRQAIESLWRMGADDQTMVKSEINARHTPLLTYAAQSYVSEGATAFLTLLELGVKPYRGGDITMSPFSALFNLPGVAGREWEKILHRCDALVSMLAKHGLPMEEAADDGVDIFGAMVKRWSGPFGSSNHEVVNRLFEILRKHLTLDTLQKMTAREMEHSVTTKLEVRKNQTKKVRLTPLAAMLSSPSGSKVKIAMVAGLIRCGASYDVPGFCATSMKEMPLREVLDEWLGASRISGGGNAIAQRQLGHMVEARQAIEEAERAYVADRASSAMRITAAPTSARPRM